MNSHNKGSLDKELESQGLKYNSYYSDSIVNGTKLHRIANSSEPIDSRYKYVSISEHDTKKYRDEYETLYIDFNKPISEYTYETKKNLKVANYKNVVDSIISKYGDKKLSDLKNDYDLFGQMHWEREYVKHPEEISKSDKNASLRIENNFYERITKIMNENIEDIAKDFKKRGYDALIDAEDKINGYDYPLILINPKTSIKKLKEVDFK